MLQTQQRLGDFEIVRPLGKGGMGEVYEARQLNPPRPVALKVLAPWLAQNEEMLQRFWREAVVPAQLDHPGIVRIIATGKTDDVAWYAMQLVRGVTLGQLIRQAAELQQARTTPQLTTSDEPTPLNAGDRPDAPAAPASEPAAPPPVLQEYQVDRYGVTARLGAQAARALASAHRQNVLHRDVKPSNLMVDHHGQLYVVDFGLTRAFVGDGLSTRLGVVCGTPWYMSPEQARGDPIDARSDVYSLGVTLYELASGGKGPYLASRADGEEVLRQVKGNQALPLRVVAPEVPPALAAVIECAMHCKPRRRYLSAEALAADLERLTTASGLQRKAAPFPWQRLTALLGFAALTVLVVMAAALFFRPDDKPPETKPASGRPPLPAMLQDRRLHYSIPLLDKRGEPLWMWTPTGTGNYFRDGGVCRPMSWDRQPMTLFALDDDPQRHWFDFSIELRAMRQRSILPRAVCQAVTWGNVPGTGPLLAWAALASGREVPRRYATGIFFGWQSTLRDPGGKHPVFLVELQEPPVDLGGPTRVTISYMIFDPPSGLRGGSTARGSRLLPTGKHSWDLDPLPANRQGWHQFRVRALDGKVTVTVDNKDLFRFDLHDLPLHLREGDERLDPRGALGVWVDKGPTYIRNAQVTALPPGG